MLSDVAFALDRAGLRPLVAKAASLVYSNQSFSVDSEGRWINEQPECTIVSPTIHTKPYSYFRDITLNEWCGGYQPKSGDTVVDLGSGVGEEVVILADLVGPSGRVIAVEAHPDTFRCLQETVARSGLTNVTPVHCAVADEEGAATINTIASHLSNTIFAGTGESVPQLSLETLCQELDRIDFLRCNIEGAERLAIQGPALSKVWNACIECHDFITDVQDGDYYQTSAEVRATLENVGFTVSQRSEVEGKPWLRYHLFATRRPLQNRDVEFR